MVASWIRFSFDQSVTKLTLWRINRTTMFAKIPVEDDWRLRAICLGGQEAGFRIASTDFQNSGYFSIWNKTLKQRKKARR
jgi:hypothetical protein